MADGRKIPYIIELLPDTKQFEKIRDKMKAIDGGELIKFDPSEVKKLKGILQGVVDDVGNRASSIGTKIQQGIASGIDKDKLQKMLDLDTSKLRETMEIVEKLTGLIDDHSKGNSWLKDGKGFLGKLSSSQQDLRSLEQSISQLELKFEGLDASLTSTIAKFDALATTIKSLQGNGKPIVVSPINVTTGTKQVQQFEKEISNLNGLLAQISSTDIKINTDNVERQFHDLVKKAENLVYEIGDLEVEMDDSDISKEAERKLMMQVAQKKEQLAQMYRQMDALNQHYQKANSNVGLSLFNQEHVFEDPKDIVKQAKEYIEYVIKELSVTTKSETAQSDNAIGVEVVLPSVDDIRKKLNSVIDQLNKPNSLHKIKLDIDDVANVIEDKIKRAYGSNPADEDASSTELVNKTATRFDRIAKVIGDKQDNILAKTNDWRKKMINAMQINAKDLEFQFGLESNMENTADALFNKLQEYFERPEYALDIKFNTEKIAKDLKAGLEAEGIELGVGGGAANIDAKTLMSMLHSILYGGTSVRTTTQATSMSDDSTQREVANETKEATDSGREYIKVLDETTIHIDKVIESLRVFAKEANKSNASKGAKAVASRLTNMGIDIGAIKNGAKDTDIIKMLQTALMSKDEMGKAQGASLVGKLEGMTQTYGMDSKKGSGKVVDILAKDIMELFNINELETELEEELVRRFEQLEIWKGIEKPGKALAALGNVRSTKKKIRLPNEKAINDAITYFKDAGEDTKALEELEEARKKFEANGETDEAKKEFEKAALVFYDKTKDVFNRLKDRWGDFKGVVQAEGRRPVTIDPKGVYPSRILEIPDDAVIAKVDIFEVFKTIRDIGFTGSSARRESSQKKAEFEQQRVTYDPHAPNYIVPKPKPKKDIRYEDIEYDTFKTQESENLPPDIALDATIESLDKQAAEIPELVERIEETKKNIVQLEEVKQQIKGEIENLQNQDLPNFAMSAFNKYSKQNSSIRDILKDSNSALANNNALGTIDVSGLDKEQQSLVHRLQTLTTNIHNDSEASQELARKIAEIVEAKKLSKEELDAARAEAARISYEKQGELRSAQQELYRLQNDSEPLDKEAKKARAKAIRTKQKEIDEINKFAEQERLYRDLLYDESSVDSRLELYQSQKSSADKNIGESKKYAQKLIAELKTSQSQSTDKATKEAEALAIQLIEAKERLYAEAKTYADILNDSNSDDKTRETALGKLQETLRGLNQITGKFATIQPYVPQTNLYSSSQQNNVDKWNKKYTSKEVNKLQKELDALESQLKTEEDETKVAELKKKIANTKRNLTRLKKNVPDNVLGKKQSELANIERELKEEQSRLAVSENRKNDADRDASKLQSTQKDAAFLSEYNELLEKEKSLLEEVNKLKREGADKSVIDGKTEELKQATNALDDFLKKEKTAERTAYARKAAVEYQAQLQTAYRKRSVFDSRIQELDDEEANLTKYGLSGRVGSRARRRALSKATSEYMSSDDVRAQEEAIRKNEQLSWEQRDKQLKELRQKLREEFAKRFDDTNVQQDELDRIATERAIAEAGREPLDDIIKDLKSQKKTAMRYGDVSDDDLKNDKYLKQNEQYNKNILKLQSDRVKLERELESIKADDSLDEKKQEKAIKSKQKEIDAVDQEIQRNQALIDNRVKLMELHKQEKEESKQTPEERALLATEKLVSMKQSLAQAEEKVVARRAEYESAKGTENEIKMLEALDNQIKKRDQIQEQIANTEKKIERLGQVVQNTEEARDEVVSTVEDVSSGESTGGLLGIIKEAVGEVGNVDLTKVEEILSNILAILSGNGVVGSVRNPEIDAKLARIKELEAKQQLANEQKKTAETARQVENAKKETASQASSVADDSRKQAISQINAYDKEKVAQWASMSDDELIATMKSLIGDMGGLNKDTIEYIQKQRELGRILNAYKEKSAYKDEAASKNGYINPKILAQKDPKLGELGLYDSHTPITSDRAVRDMFGVAEAEKKTKAKQEEAKAEEKITEEKKEQERITFTRRERKELNRLKNETKDYNPDAPTSVSSEYNGFATENTLRAVLEVLNKISTSGVPKSGGQTKDSDKSKTPKKTEADLIRDSALKQQDVIKGLAAGRGSLYDQYMKDVEDLNNAVKEANAADEAHKKKAIAKVKTQAQKVSALSYNILKNTSEWDYIVAQSDTGARDLNVKKGESVKDKMEKMALREHGIIGKNGKELKNPKNQYKFLGFDGETLSYQLTDIEGNVRKVTMVWNEFNKQVAITSDKSIGKLSELAGKVESFKGKFEDAVSVGHLAGDDKDLARFAAKVEEIQSKIAKGASIGDIDQLRKEAIAIASEIDKTVAKNRRMYSGTTEVNAVEKRHIGLENSGVLENSDMELVKRYTVAYNELIAKYKEFKDAKTLSDPNNQNELQKLAVSAKNLGKQLEKSAAEAQRLQELVESSGFYNGKQMGGIKVLDATEMGNLESSMRSYLESLGLGNVEHIKFDNIHKKLTGTLRTSNKTVADLEVKYNEATGALYAYQKAERESLTGIPAFLNGFKKKFNSIMQYLTMTMSIHRVMSELRRGVQYIREIDLALTELKKVTDETEETYDRFLETAAKTGARLGATISAVTEATATFAKLGYDMVTATEMAEAAIVYKNVGDNIASTEDAADSIISTLKGFGMEASEAMAIVDRFNEVGE